MGVFCEEERFLKSSHCFLGIGSPLAPIAADISAILLRT
jgi:hypothetical protein